MEFEQFGDGVLALLEVVTAKADGGGGDPLSDAGRVAHRELDAPDLVHRDRQLPELRRDFEMRLRQRHLHAAAVGESDHDGMRQRSLFLFVPERDGLLVGGVTGEG